MAMNGYISPASTEVPVFIPEAALDNHAVENLCTTVVAIMTHERSSFVANTDVFVPLSYNEVGGGAPVQLLEGSTCSITVFCN